MSHQVQDSCCVPSESGNLGQRGVPPEDDLVLGVAVCAHELVGPIRPRQVANLGTCVNRLQGLPCHCVPEPNGLVSCSSSRGEDTMLHRRDRSRYKV